MDRKKDIYINNAIITNSNGDNLLSDIYIEHNSLPELKFEDIDTTSEIFGKNISFPLIISPMTGGTELGFEINEKLVQLSRHFNIPLTVGSQNENIESEDLSKLYVDGEASKDTIIISNMSANSKETDIYKSVKNINATALSLYLNTTQEAISFDRNKDFTNILSNIENINKKFGKNLIVKEKGSGMSKDTVKKLVNAGVKYIDISGFGGTNIVELENMKNYRNDFSELYGWGIPTAKSILNARSIDSDLKIIASGGIKSGLEIAKALIIGADYVSVAGELLKHLIHGGYEQAKNYLEQLIYNTKVVMFLLGVKNIEELKNVDYKVTGKLKEIL